VIRQPRWPSISWQPIAFLQIRTIRGQHHAVDPRRPDHPANLGGDLVTDMPGLHGLLAPARIFSYRR